MDRTTCFIEKNGRRYYNFEGRGRLMFITHGNSRYDELEEVRMVLDGGCDWVQLRMKEGLNVETASAVAKCVAERGQQAVCCLDDNLEIALQSGIHTLHLGKKDMPVAEAWKKVEEVGQKSEFVIGATANTFEDIVNADKAGASYIGLGPFRFTETKKNLSPVLGLEGYRKIVAQCKAAQIEIPIFAIGGITIEDIPALMETGITGIAISGAIIGAEDPVEETRRFMKAINAAL